MAPEQFRAEPADARTDQFSYCVSLYEALYGERPFAADSLAGLLEAVTAGTAARAAARFRVPAWLRKVLLRGLAVKREDRFPTMENLLAALARDPERRRRRVADRRQPRRRSARGRRTGPARAARFRRGDVPECSREAGRRPGSCRTRSRRTHDETPSAPRSLRRASGAPRDVWERTAGILDDYARRWAAMYGESCEATRVRGEQSTDVLDLRTDCLSGNRDSLHALTDLLATADVDMVEQGDRRRARAARRSSAAPTWRFSVSCFRCRAIRRCASKSSVCVSGRPRPARSARPDRWKQGIAKARRCAMRRRSWATSRRRRDIVAAGAGWTNGLER